MNIQWGPLGQNLAWGWALQVGTEQRSFSVSPLQLCEDLFSRVGENQNAQLSYSVEVSPGLSGAEMGLCVPGWGKAGRLSDLWSRVART